MAFVSKNPKAKISDKKKADKIYAQLLRYAIYGTMVLGLTVVVVIATQQKPHDTRSRASSEPYESPMELTQENQEFGTHCYTSQDLHTRTWTGKLESDNSFTIDLPFCQNESIENLAIAATTTRNTSFSLSAISPSGKIIYPQTVNEFTKTVCVIPTQSEIEKGNWQVVLTTWENEYDNSEISVIVGPQTFPAIQEICSL